MSSTPGETEEDREFKNNLGLLSQWLLLGIKKKHWQISGGKIQCNSEKQNVWQEMEAIHINHGRERQEKQKEEDGKKKQDEIIF